MTKVWINPAYKDMVQAPKAEEKKEEKPVVKEQPKVKTEQNQGSGMVQITESVLNRLKKKDEVNTDKYKLTDLIGKGFTKANLKDELKARGIPGEDINKIISRAKEKKDPNLLPPNQGRKQAMEYQLFKYFIDKEIPIEFKLINGETFTGKIKWFSEWLVGLAVEGKSRTVIIPRLMIVYYTQLQENSLSEKEIKQLPLSDIANVEVRIMQQFKDNKTPLMFHMQGGMEIKGTLDWYEKLVYHIKGPEGKTEHTLHRGNMLYLEEAV